MERRGCRRNIPKVLRNAQQRIKKKVQRRRSRHEFAECEDMCSAVVKNLLCSAVDVAPSFHSAKKRAAVVEKCLETCSAVDVAASCQCVKKRAPQKKEIY